MNDNPSLMIEITGYTDSQGKDGYNQRLSHKRAKKIKDILTDAGIASKRITTKGMGKSNPVAINENPDGSDNPEGRAFNRRIIFNIIKCDNPHIIVEPLKVPGNLKIKN